MRKVGIFGGTFNPIHCGHLMMSEYLREECGLEEVILMPTGNPPHKVAQVSASERNEMVRIAVADNCYFSVSDLETNRQGLSYTVDTIRELQKEEDREMYFIIGLDTLFELKSWKKFEELAKEIRFIVALRPNYMQKNLMEQELDFLKNQYNANIELVQTPLYEISSSELRDRLAKGKSVRYLIPNEVIQYIEEKGLYRKE